MSDEKEFVDAGLRIRVLRGGATQGEFAERLGVNRKTVERWEAGERLPDGQSLLALMTVCGADVNYILTGQRAGCVKPTPSLAQDEEILLDNYRNSPPDAKAAIKAASDAFARPARGGKRAA